MLTEENKQKLSRCYEQLAGRKLKPPEREKRAIHLEAKMEGDAEISKLMQESPNYVIDVQGRE